VEATASGDTRVRLTLVAALLAALIVVGDAAWVAHALGLVHRPKQVLETDHRSYIAMALEGPLAAHTDAPFCWRLLTPALVNAAVAAGADVNVAFYALTSLALFGFLFTLHRLLLRLGFEPRFAALGLVLAGLLQGAVRWYHYQYWMTDPLGLFLLALAFLLVETRRDAALALLGALAAANRETSLIVFPYHLARGLRAGGGWRALARSVAVAVPAVLVLGGIRYGLVPRPDESLVATVREALGFRWRHLFDNQLYLASLGSFGVLLPLALLHPSRLGAWLCRRPQEAVVMAVAYASLALANNTERLLAYALPVAVPAALRGLRAGLDAGRLPFAPVAALVLGLQLLYYVTTPFHGILGLSLYQPVNWVIVVAMAAFWVAFRARLRAHASRAPA